MILAAAIRYHIPATGKEVVLCGARHGDVFRQLAGLGFVPGSGYEELEQGFIDHNGTFLGREGAYEHSKACGQLAAKIVHERENGCVGGKKLISEDLW